MKSCALQRQKEMVSCRRPLDHAQGQQPQELLARDLDDGRAGAREPELLFSEPFPGRRYKILGAYNNPQ